MRHSHFAPQPDLLLLTQQQQEKLFRGSDVQGPAFESGGQQQGGRVLSWIQHMLTKPPSVPMSSSKAARGPAKPVVAQTALLNLLSTNVDLFNTCVDQCYAAEPMLSRAYFQVPFRQKLCGLFHRHLSAKCDTTRRPLPKRCFVTLQLRRI